MEITTTVDDQVFAAVIDFALGSNHQGRSFVGKDRDGQARRIAPVAVSVASRLGSHISTSPRVGRSGRLPRTARR